MAKNKGFAIALAIVVGIAIAIWNSPVIQEPFEKAGTEDDIVIPENFREDMAKLVKN